MENVLIDTANVKCKRGRGKFAIITDLDLIFMLWKVESPVAHRRKQLA